MSTEFDPDADLARLNHELIALDATVAAGHLAEHGHASVFISPGDMTEYHFVIVAPGTVEYHDYHGLRERREYHVSLASSFGASYAWAGMEVHPSYAAANWTRRSGTTITDMHTGVVVAAFLNALAKEFGA